MALKVGGQVITEGQSPRKENDLAKAVREGKITESGANDIIASRTYEAALMSSPERQAELAAQQQVDAINHILREAPISYTMEHEQQNREKLNDLLDKIECSLDSNSPHCVQAIDKFYQQVQAEQKEYVDEKLKTHFMNKP